MLTAYPRNSHRMARRNAPSLRNWGGADGRESDNLPADVIIPCGWGRLIIGHTFADQQVLADTLCEETPGQRDIALYLRDPHVLLSLAPHQLFLDPSNTYRLWLSQYRAQPERPQGFHIRKLQSDADAEAVNRIYATRGMVAVDRDFIHEQRKSRILTYFVAEDADSGHVVGTVTGVDYRRAFEDPEHGSSLWCLAVDPLVTRPGVGEALVRHLVEHYQARGRAFVDLSVMHDNAEAIALYEKLGFQRVPVFCIKHKNTINEPLYIAPPPDDALNPYAQIIVDEARRRGINVDVDDAANGVFTLRLGGRSITCRESLSQLTSAVAMTLCQDKALTTRWLAREGLNVPAQTTADSEAANGAFLIEHGSVVVKPACGEQGAGISVDVRTADGLAQAVEAAARFGDKVLIEQYVTGSDLRIVVIDFQIVAAALRKPARIVGDGRHDIRQLIDKQSRRRAAATGGESRIPVDAETERCVREAGFAMDDIPATGVSIEVRKTANLHTGGTLHDVTDTLHPTLREAAVRAARALDIPVVGLDFLVPSAEGDRYVIIEANERPGLANHEPQPTAQRFIDLLFPQTTSGEPVAKRGG